MGGDHGPPVAAAGAARALERLGGRPVRFHLHGEAARIEAELARHPALRGACEVVHTDKVIAGDDKPAQALRRGKGSSLWNAVAQVKAGEADAAVSGGNTGALMAISKLLLRMTGTLDRPAIVASWPTLTGVTSVLDVGANIECDAAQLVEFAVMGEAFHCAVHMKHGQPVVGVLNVGSEDQKGREEVREAHRLLKGGALPIRYHGFVEGDDIARGTVDVVVTDGFTGNAVLKTGEGLARFFAQTLRETLSGDPLAMAGGLLAKGALQRMRARLTPPGGGPLLGLNGTVVKAHGGADAEGFADALVIACDLAASDYAQQTARNLRVFADGGGTQAPSAPGQPHGQVNGEASAQATGEAAA